MNQTEGGKEAETPSGRKHKKADMRGAKLLHPSSLREATTHSTGKQSNKEILPVACKLSRLSSLRMKPKKTPKAKAKKEKNKKEARFPRGLNHGAFA